MPLRTTTPIPIRVAPQPGLASAVAAGPPGASGMNFEAAPAQAMNPLPISPVIQKESQWCWAACVEMVTGFLNAPKTQCEAVTNFPGTKPAGDPGPCLDSNRFRAIGCEIDEMNKVWDSLDVSCVLIPKPAGQPALPFQVLADEINAGRPIEVGIAWSGGGGHAMLVKGHGEIDGNLSVWINDPLGATTRFGSSVQGGEGQILFRELRVGNGYGKWVCSWMNLALKAPPSPEG